MFVFFFRKKVDFLENMKLFSVICFLIITIGYSESGEGSSGNVLGDIQVGKFLNFR